MQKDCTLGCFIAAMEETQAPVAKKYLNGNLETSTKLGFGQSVRIQDPLSDITEGQLANRMKTGGNGLAEKVKHLRRLANIDPAAAKVQKANLPFFIGAVFSPNLRKLENFVRIDYLVLDLDAVEAKGGQDPMVLRDELSTDSRVLMAFVSPSGNGVKLVFKLQIPCFDPNQWKMAYLGFARSFCDEHQLGDMADTVCSDVSRVCFLSHDPGMFFCPLSQQVDWKDYLPSDEDHLDFSKDNTQSPKGITYVQNLKKEQKTNQEEQKEPSDDQLAKIRKQLNPNAAPKKTKQYFLPPEVTMMEGLVEQRAEGLGIVVKEIRPVNYGKKFVFSLGPRWCEVNLFHGKKGYSCTVTPKSGSDRELAETCRAVVEEVVVNS